MLRLKLTQNRSHVKCGKPNSLFALLDVAPEESAAVKGQKHHISLVIDCSGSMSGEKIENAKNAAISVVDSLDPNDLVSIVIFETEVKIVLDPTPASASGVKEAIRSIRAMGGTAMYGGMDAAFRILEKTISSGLVCRMEVFTDGHPNVEPIDNKSFLDLTRRARDSGITVDVFGIGEDYNESLLLQIAESGGGKWQHVSNSSELAKMVNEQVTEMQNTVILSPQLQITLMRGAEISKIAITKPVLQDIDPGMMRKSGDTTYIKIKDIIKGESQAIAMRVQIPVLDGGTEMSMLTASINEGSSKVAEQTAFITCSDDPALYNAEGDPGPRAVFSSSEATLLIRKGLDGDQKALETADTILKSLDAETVASLDEDAQATVINAKKISGDVQGEVSESELKQIKYDSTVISKKKQDGQR
ncbi:MAG: VWA domain-containing protein [Gammaproteobacteria bacterium]|nr:VWA domain-containing protein [Gammaproteobacteria bacterium]